MKSQKLLESFVTYCQENPEFRFWQALRNWSRWSFIGVSNDLTGWTDTMFWEGRSNFMDGMGPDPKEGPPYRRTAPVCYLRQDVR